MLWLSLLLGVSLSLAFHVSQSNAQDAKLSAVSPCNVYRERPCAANSFGQPPHWRIVHFWLSSRCHRRDFQIRPRYVGGVVGSSTLFVAGSRTDTDVAPPFNFKVRVKRFRRGTPIPLRLVTNFKEGGAPVVINTSFIRCKLGLRKR